jgi:Ca-activated chloride channel family protein
MRTQLVFCWLLPLLLLPSPTPQRGVVISGRVTESGGSKPLPATTIVVAGTNRSASTDSEGRYTIAMPTAARGDSIVLDARRIGYRPEQRTIVVARDTARVDFALTAQSNRLNDVVMADSDRRARLEMTDATAARDASSAAPEYKVGTQAAVRTSAPYAGAAAGIASVSAAERRPPGLTSPATHGRRDPAHNTEQYDRIYENPFLGTDANPRSTFSIDVDRASYSNIRRFIDQGLEPPKDAVRIEELVNYFTYDYPEPRGASPVSITTDVAPAPWKPAHRLVRIGLKGRSIDKRELPASNLVFLIDVSGSMSPSNKLPLVKAAFRMLVNELREEDRVSIVVYAGAAGTVLSPTPGSDKTRIMDAIERLEAGGSTAGGAGLKLAYDIARKTHVRGGNNRVILATDGDFNVGMSSDAEMVRLIEERRGQGTFLTVLGFGMGNLKDSRLEKLADKGNGNYAYIDDLMEARKTLVHEFGGTMVTIAKDVKLQVEFNPTKVAAYRLIGYENRLLRDQDFNDDTKDAGEIGSGHTVTALYEVIPVGARTDQKVEGVDALRYQAPSDRESRADSDELLFVRLRYKDPNGDTSKLIERPVVDRGDRPSADFTFASAVAAFGLVLRDSEFKGSATLDDVLRAAKRSVGEDPNGYRADFVRVVEAARKIGRTEGVGERGW